MPLFGAQAVLSPPLPSLMQLDAGLTIPRRSFDRWTMGAKPPQTFLTSSIPDNGATTTINVAPVPGNGSAAGIYPSSGAFRIKIDNEEMLVTGGAGTLVWTVVRHTNGTTGATHANGATVLGSAITHVVLAGDSTMQGTVGANDEFAQRFSRMLGRTMGGSNGLAGRGFRGVWLSGNNANIGGGASNSLTEWSSTGNWPLVTQGGINDQAPWAWAVTATGSTNVLIWTRPANIPVAAIEVQYIVAASLNVPSYSVDGGTTWNAFTISAPLNELQSFTVNVANPTDFRIRAATSTGTSIVAIISGIIVWSVVPSFGVTQGVMVHNLGKDGDFLNKFNRANASGDNFAFFDGHQGSIYPDLVCIGPFTNDLQATGQGGIPTYIASLTTFVNRVRPYADVLLLNYCEQNRAAPAQAPDQAAQRAAVQALGASLNVGVLDIYDAFSAEGLVGFTAVNAAGLMNDNLHCNQAGNNDIGARLMRGLGVTTL